MPPSRPDGTQAAGFTLLEVLVAVAVLAVALGAVIKAVSENAANAAYLRDRTLAHWVAADLVTEQQLAPVPPPAGTRRGTAVMARRDWAWELRVSPTPDAGILRLEVSVRLAPDGREELAALTGFTAVAQ